MTLIPKTKLQEELDELIEVEEGAAPGVPDVDVEDEEPKPVAKRRVKKTSPK